MVHGLIGIIFLVIVVGVVLLLAKLLLDAIPMDGKFKQIAWVLIILVAILIVLQKLLPMVGVSAPF